MSRNRKLKNRRRYTPLNLDQLSRVIGLTPWQKIEMRRYMIKKLGRVG